MKTAGIIAEYNPYHNGHRFLAGRLREDGATHVVAVMSGHLVQRGEVALFSKWARAEAALRSGVDLVLELPSLFACRSAERFASAAVSLLEAAGCVDCLGFGSESGDLSLLSAAAREIVSPEADALLKEALSRGVPYAAARQAAVEQTAGTRTAAVLSAPNDILAVEYLKALRAQGSAMCPTAVKRRGAAHDSAEPSAAFASGSFLREALLAGEDVSRFFPAPAWEVFRRETDEGRGPCRLDALETAILLRLRGMTKEAFAALPDVSEGLEHRLFRAARTARTLEEFYAFAKTRRYAHARLRRIALYAALGVTKEDLSLSPPYLRILGLNGRGAELAARMKETAKLPYGTSLKKLAQGAAAERTAQVEEAAGDLFALGVPGRLPAGIDYTAEAIVLM